MFRFHPLRQFIQPTRCQLDQPVGSAVIDFQLAIWLQNCPAGENHIRHIAVKIHWQDGRENRFIRATNYAPRLFEIEKHRPKPVEGTSSCQFDTVINLQPAWVLIGKAPAPILNESQRLGQALITGKRLPR